MLEAAALQEDLRRARIEPGAWIVNASLTAVGPSDPLPVAGARSERSQIDKVRKELARRIALVPWLAEEPVGRERLSELVRPRNGVVPRSESGARR